LFSLKPPSSTRTTLDALIPEQPTWWQWHDHLCRVSRRPLPGRTMTVVPGIQDSPATHPLDLFHERCLTLADRVEVGELPFIDAVDLAYSAADFAGLVNIYGDDTVQTVLAAAFMRCRR
jgi:hypothetical protein